MSHKGQISGKLQKGRQNAFHRLRLIYLLLPNSRQLCDMRRQYAPRIDKGCKAFDNLSVPDAHCPDFYNFILLRRKPGRFHIYAHIFFHFFFLLSFF